MLFGSNILPAHISIRDRQVQLGDVVRRAYRDSRLTMQSWNDMPELEREYALVRAIYAMRAEAAQEASDGQS